MVISDDWLMLAGFFAFIFVTTIVVLVVRMEKSNRAADDLFSALADLLRDARRCDDPSCDGECRRCRAVASAKKALKRYRG